MKKLGILLIIGLLSLRLEAQLKHEIFEFEFEEVVLNGVLNMPEGTNPKGLVLIVHGSGKTKAVEQAWYLDVREQFVESGYAVYMWDKMGCGKSGGTFDYNQSVQSSAQEVLAAIKTLQKRQIPGANEIGLWGISRGGWINPLVIQQYEDIKFWISVSGVDAKENFKYLLEENLRINGHPKDSIDLIVGEWHRGNMIGHEGGSYESYLAATTNLRRNPFWVRFTNGESSETGYKQWQASFMEQELDEESELPVYIPDFESILSQVKCPVLALFGEQDMNVDWTQTKALYEHTLGQNTELTIRSFPDCNHNIFQCKTGGFYEMQDHKLPWNRCEGFLETMRDWLLEQEQE